MMDFKVKRGERFSEEFNFKTQEGKDKLLPPGDYRISVEHSPVAYEYTLGHGLTAARTKLIWTIPAGETKDFEYNTMYYTLYLGNTELTRGILRLQ